MLAWIATGLWWAPPHAVSTETATAESGAALGHLLKVEAMTARPYTRRITLNGYTKPHRMLVIQPEVEGRVVELPVQKGAQLRQGQLILRMDMRDRTEKLAQAKATLEARRVEFEAAETLERKGYRPRISLAQAKASLEEARATMAQAQLELEHTRITAAFDGRLEELNVELGSLLLPGLMGSFDPTVVARLVDDRVVKVVGQIAEKDLPMVERNATVDIELSDGRKKTGKIGFLGQYADAANRSFPVEIWVENPTADIPLGITASIQLPAGTRQAYLVSSSVLALDDSGKVGVKLVDDGGMVQFHLVELLANTPEGLWIAGLPDSIRLVTQGQAFVNAGQKWQEPAPAPATKASGT